MSKKKLKTVGRGKQYNAVRDNIRAARELAAKVQGRSLLKNLRPIITELETIAQALGK
jgi:hypothetical protein